MSRFNLDNHQATSVSTLVSKGIGILGVGGLLVSALVFSIEGVESIETSNCSSCTTTISGTDGSSYTLSDGDVFCIASGGTFTGSIQRNSGNGSVIICNEGTISGASMSFNKGENYIENYGTMTGSTVAFNNSAKVGSLNNHDGAFATFASVNFYTKDTEVHNYGTFSTGGFILSSGATFTNYATGSVTSGNVQLNQNTVLRNDASWDVTGNVAINSQGELDNNAAFTITGNLENNNDLFSAGTLEIDGNLTMNANSETQLANVNTVGGNVTLNKGLTIDGSLAIEGSLTVNSSGNLYINGAVTVETDFTTGGDLFGKAVGSGQYGTIAIQGVTTIYGSGNLNDNLDFCDAGEPAGGADNFWGNADATVTYCENTGETLPVEWLAFEASPGPSGVDLMWMTAVEENNDFFTVERSVDANFYEELARVKGEGNSSEPTMYEATDDTPPSGRIYYRIRQTDFDGQQSLSNQVEVMFEQSNITLRAYPNPAIDLANLEINMEESTRASMILMTIQGREIMRQAIDLQAGRNLQQIDVSRYPAGTYLIQVRPAGNAKGESIRLVKQ